MTPESPAIRVGFAGTPAFAAVALAAIIEAGFDVALVLTQPDRPKGRGLNVASSPVKELALRHSLRLLQPPTLRTDSACAAIVATPLDVLVVVAYGLLLPRAVLSWPRFGCINVHASLLPRWRGAAPIQRALLAGDAETGITIMQMDAGLDTGPVLQSVRIPIAPRASSGTLHDELAATGAQSIVGVLTSIARGELPQAIPQATEGATYASKIETADTVIDWCADAQAIDRQVRALHPAPGAIAAIDGRVVKIRAASPVDSTADSASPGTIIDASSHGLVVACGKGALALLEVQPAGGRAMSGRAFVAGRRIAAGARFDRGVHGGPGN